VVTATASKRPAATRLSNLRPLNFAELRQQVSITQILEHCAWQPQSVRGVQRRGACPIHEGAKPRSRDFAVQTEKQVFCCHRCGIEGNVLDLWVALSGQPLLEAAWDLVKTFGLEPPLLEEGPPDTNP
jgi:DNA primase